MQNDILELNIKGVHRKEKSREGPSLISLPTNRL